MNHEMIPILILVACTWYLVVLTVMLFLGIIFEYPNGKSLLEMVTEH